MDQSVIAGIGNVYRAELLHRAGLDPFIAGHNLDRASFERLWADTVALMAVGADANRIYTTSVDLDWARGLLEQGQTPPRRRPTYAVYLRTGRPCPRCGQPVQSQLLSGRRLFWCAGCQRGR